MGLFDFLKKKKEAPVEVKKSTAFDLKSDNDFVVKKDTSFDTKPDIDFVVKKQAAHVAEVPVPAPDPEPEPVVEAPAPVPAPDPAPKPGKSAKILEQYREGLAYLDSCGPFDEAKFREFNRIIGNRFSENDIQSQLRNASMMTDGMEGVRAAVRSAVAEAIGTFEQLERQGIDLSQYDL